MIARSKKSSLVGLVAAQQLVYPENTNLPGSDKPVGDLMVDVFKNVMEWLASILAIVGVIGFLVSGIIYITSAGNDDRMQMAKRAMFYSVIGMAVGLLAWGIILTIDMLLGGDGGDPPAGVRPGV